MIPTSTSRFNELPPIEGLEPSHFDVFENELFSHKNKAQNWEQRFKTYRLGRVKKLQTHPGKGPLVEYVSERDAVHRIRLKQKYLLLNCCPPGMYSFEVLDVSFRANIELYWEQIKMSVTDWWWTARFQRSPFMSDRSHYGFVFRAETDAILCSQIIEDLELPHPRA